MGLFKEIIGLTKPYPDETAPEFPEFTTKGAKASPPHDAAKSDKVRTIHTTTQLQVVVVQPEHFETANEIADHLLERNTVVLNLERANKEATRRMVDFLSGVVYALRGKVKPIAKNAYIITPSNIDVMGADLIGELESSGLYI
jgi:cell division inhibitor SepF